MCGIVGYIGNQNAAPVLISGLKELEYRGYDSAGIAVRNQNGVQIHKAKGKVERLQRLIDKCGGVSGRCGIGHTRWATHGLPTEKNAHPHCSSDKKVVLVHNGIIENHQDLRRRLKQAGYTFSSETDSEVAANLLAYHYRKHKDSAKAIIEASKDMKGSFALGILFDQDKKLYATRKGSPLVVGCSDGHQSLASDPHVAAQGASDVYCLEDGETAILDGTNVSFLNHEGKQIAKKTAGISGGQQQSSKDGFKHYMLKEINEQPEAVKNTIDSIVDLQSDTCLIRNASHWEHRSFERIWVVACGSAYHAGMVIKHAFESLSETYVQVELASEFRYGFYPLSSRDMVIFVSQSGETADTLEALRKAKSAGALCLSIANVPNSSLDREADLSYLTKAGREISVATTKAYSAQLAVGYLLALQYARQTGKIGYEEALRVLDDIRSIPGQMRCYLEDKEERQRLIDTALLHKDAANAFFIGRGVCSGLAMEGALKLKEVSYMHAESYASGELKHGSISLIEDGTPVFAVLDNGIQAEKTLSNLAEVRARGAAAVVVASEGCGAATDESDRLHTVPSCSALTAPSLYVLPLQMIAYHIADMRGLDVDQPRNLAKSVTVE